MLPARPVPATLLERQSNSLQRLPGMGTDGMLPNPHNNPPRGSKLRNDPLAARDVSRDLRPPVGAVRLPRSVAPPAALPETSAKKDCYALPAEDDIWPPRETRISAPPGQIY